MGVGGTVGNTAHGRRRHIRHDGETPYESKIEGQRQVAALTLAGGFTAIVLAGRVVRNLGMSGVSRGRAVQRTCLVLSTHVQRRRMHALRHCMGNVHFEPKGEL